jgi:hypothetical protein
VALYLAAELSCRALLCADTITQQLSLVLSPAGLA